MPSLDKCRVRAVWLRSGLAGLMLTLVAAGLLPAQIDQTALNGQIERLTRQLNDDQAKRRDEAEQALLKLAPVDKADQCDAFLELLPQPLEGMPEEVRLRLTRLRREIETRQANQALSASRLSLSAN